VRRRVNKPSVAISSDAEIWPAERPLPVGLSTSIVWWPGLRFRGLGMGFVFGGVSGLSDRVVTIGNGGPKKVDILRVGRWFVLAALLICC